MGTSVKVEKYIRAPKTEANRDENNLFPPNTLCTTSSGSAFEMIPAIKTPTNKNGRIFFANVQVSPIHSLRLSFWNRKYRAMIPSTERTSKVVFKTGLNDKPPVTRKNICRP